MEVVENELISLSLQSLESGCEYFVLFDQTMSLESLDKVGKKSMSTYILLKPVIELGTAAFEFHL
jgi:hypothetical protein